MALDTPGSPLLPLLIAITHLLLYRLIVGPFALILIFTTRGWLGLPAQTDGKSEGIKGW